MTMADLAVGRRDEGLAARVASPRGWHRAGERPASRLWLWL